jgi:hypothetical protein
MPALKYLKRNLEAITTTRLEKLGKTLATAAYKHGFNEWVAHTGNLDAGFGYAVYLRGNIAYNTDREKAYGYAPGMFEELQWHRGWDAMGIPDGDAALWFDRWLESYTPKSKAWELVVVNVTFYGKILEEGRQGLGGGRKYKVITYLLSDLVKMAKDLNMDVKDIGLL